jgi:RHS repeat-associated protein
MQDESYSPQTPEGGLSPFLFNGKELQTFADLNFYDYHWRQYDPQLGRWHSPDPADQFFGISGYAYCANNPVMLTDPDGRWVHIVIGAVVGGVINVATHWNKIDNFGDGLAAFGIGAGAGALAAATGGAGAAAILGTKGAATFGGVLLTGAIGSAVASPIQGLGNAAYFGDVYSLEQWGTDILTGTVAAGASYGIGKGFAKLFPKTTETISRAVQRIEAKVKNWFNKPVLPTSTGGRQGIVEGGDLTFVNTADDITGITSDHAWGYKTGDIYYSNTVAQVQAKLSLYPQVIDPRTGGLIPMPITNGIAPRGSRVDWTNIDRGNYIKQWYNNGYSTPTGGWKNYDIHHILPRQYGGNNDFWNLVPVERNTHKLFNNFWKKFGNL